tara:strand:+ start:161 stop:499 length:339 start_codon:yes stop_codon:yes gene_type:complete
MSNIIQVEFDGKNGSVGVVKENWSEAEEDSVLFIDGNESPLLSSAIKTVVLPPELGGTTVNVQGKRGIIKTCPKCMKTNHCVYSETDGKQQGKYLMVVHCLSDGQFAWCYAD